MKLDPLSEISHWWHDVPPFAPTRRASITTEGDHSLESMTHFTGRLNEESPPRHKDRVRHRIAVNSLKHFERAMTGALFAGRGGALVAGRGVFDQCVGG